MLASGEALIRTPLEDLVGELDPEKFWQVHRGAIVNLDAVFRIRAISQARASRPRSLA